MSTEDLSYHRQRERHCRTMAELASDPEARRRHSELAELHAARVASFSAGGQSSQLLS